MVSLSHGICPACNRLRRLDPDGTVAFHHLAIKVSRRAVKTIGAGKVTRRCPGSGRPPRRSKP